MGAWTVGCGSKDYGNVGVAARRQQARGRERGNKDQDRWHLKEPQPGEPERGRATKQAAEYFESNSGKGLKRKKRETSRKLKTAKPKSEKATKERAERTKNTTGARHQKERGFGKQKPGRTEAPNPGDPSQPLEKKKQRNPATPKKENQKKRVTRKRSRETASLREGENMVGATAHLKKEES